MPSFYKVGSSTASTNGSIYTLKQVENLLFIGGDFTSIGSIYANAIVIWTGEEWLNIGTGLTNSNGTKATVKAIEVYDEYIFIVGNFDRADGISVDNIVVLYKQTDGTYAYKQIPGFDLISNVKNIDGNLFICGDLGNNIDTPLGIWNSDTEEWEETTTDIVYHNEDINQIIVKDFVKFNDKLFLNTDKCIVYQNNLYAFYDPTYAPSPDGVLGVTEDLVIWNRVGIGFPSQSVNINGYPYPTKLYDLEVYQDLLYVCGTFFRIGQQSSSPLVYTSHMGIWNGSSWSGVGSVSDSRPIRSLLGINDTQEGELLQALYIGGSMLKLPPNVRVEKIGLYDVNDAYSLDSFIDPNFGNSCKPIFPCNVTVIKKQENVCPTGSGGGLQGPPGPPGPPGKDGEGITDEEIDQKVQQIVNCSYINELLNLNTDNCIECNFITNCVEELRANKVYTGLLGVNTNSDLDPNDTSTWLQVEEDNFHYPPTVLDGTSIDTSLMNENDVFIDLGSRTISHWKGDAFSNNLYDLGGGGGTIPEIDCKDIDFESCCVGKSPGMGLGEYNCALFVVEDDGIDVTVSGVKNRIHNGLHFTYRGESETQSAWDIGTGISVLLYEDEGNDLSGLELKEINPGNSFRGLRGLAVKPKENGGILVDDDGVSVKPKENAGILVDVDGVSIDPDYISPSECNRTFYAKIKSSVLINSSTYTPIWEYTMEEIQLNTLNDDLVNDSSEDYIIAYNMLEKANTDQQAFGFQIEDDGTGNNRLKDFTGFSIQPVPNETILAVTAICTTPDTTNGPQNEFDKENDPNNQPRNEATKFNYFSVTNPITGSCSGVSLNSAVLFVNPT